MSSAAGEEDEEPREAVRNLFKDFGVFIGLGILLIIGVVMLITGVLKMLSGIIIFVAIVAAVVYFVVIRKRNRDEDGGGGDTTAAEGQAGYKEFDRAKLDELYRMLVAADYAITGAGAEYWAACGTLLGIERHAGFIPWDFDIDVQMPAGLFHSRKRRIKELLNEVGYDLSEDSPDTCGDMARVVRKGKNFLSTDLHMDVFTLDMRTGEPPNIKKHVKAYKCMKPGVENVLPTKLRKFGPLNIPAPGNAAAACRASYGEKWDTEAKGKNQALTIDLTKTKIEPLLPTETFMKGEDPRLVEHAKLMYAN